MKVAARVKVGAGFCTLARHGEGRVIAAGPLHADKKATAAQAQAGRAGLMTHALIVTSQWSRRANHLARKNLQLLPPMLEQVRLTGQDAASYAAAVRIERLCSIDADYVEAHFPNP